MKLIFVIAGGGFGAAARYGVRLMFPSAAMSFPYATLVVNVSGSFLAGLITGLIAGGLVLSGEMRLFLLVGFLGSFTTFSAFSIETLEQLTGGSALLGAVNVLLSLLLCISGALAGFFFGKMMV